jgi:hypothetical protein
MAQKGRIFLRVLEWAGWSTAIGITVGTLTVDVVADYPWFFSRAFGLAALGGAVLTLVRWLHDISQPVQAALAVGINAGRKMGRMEERLAAAERWNDPSLALGRADNGFQGSHLPAGWRRH